MNDITALIIRYTGNNVWAFYDQDNNERFEIYYSGGGNNGRLNFKSKTGGNVFNEIHYSIITYEDAIDPSNNFTPTSALQLASFLKDVGFFDGSTGGGGGVSTLLELEDVSTTTYLGKSGWALIVNEDEQTVSFKQVSGLVQDNIGRRHYLTLLGTVSTQAIVTAVNNGAQFEVTETESLWLIVQHGLNLDNQTPTLSKYKVMVKGKGIYGLGGTVTLVKRDLEFIGTYGASVEDVEDDPNTDIIDYDPLTFPETVSQWLNEQSTAIDIQEQTDGYTLFKGTVDGVQKDFLFIGDAGLYGVGELQSTMEDFQLLDRENPAVAVPDVRDLPENFIVSCVNSQNMGGGIFYSRLMYITDQKRYFFVEPEIFPLELYVVGNGISVFVEGNDVYSLWVKYPNNTTADNKRVYVVLALYDCQIIDGVLTPLTTNYKEIPEAELFTTITPSVTMHGEFFKDGYLYYASREQSADTRFLKVNAKNLEDYTVVNAADLGIPAGGGFHNIECWGNWMYFVWVQFDDATNGHIGRVDLDFKYYEVVKTINTDPTRLFVSQYPFLIADNEIFLPTVNNSVLESLRNNLRIMVYDLNGNFKRESEEMPIATGNTGLLVFPHWISIINNKLLIHTACGSSGVKKIVRVDAGYGIEGEAGHVAPTLEESVDSPSRNLTDDNTITTDGKVWLNSEASTSFPLERRLYVIEDYRDLTTIVEYDSDDYSSGGTPPTRVKREVFTIPSTSNANIDEYASVAAFPVIGEPETIYLSQEEGMGYWWDGIEYRSLGITEIVVDGTPLTPTSMGSVSFTTGGSGSTNLSYTPSPTDGTVNSDTGTDATLPLADTTNAGLLSPSDKTKLNNTPANTNTSLAAKEDVISGNGYVFSTGTTKSFVTGNANEVVLANATKENKNTLVNGATLSVLSPSNQAITASLAYLNIVNQLQGQITGYTAITANLTLTTAHRIIDVTANSITVTLPTAVGIAGRQYTIKNSGSGTTVTVATTSGQTIDGAASKSIAVQYEGLTVLSDGANWKIIATF